MKLYKYILIVFLPSIIFCQIQPVEINRERNSAVYSEYSYLVSTENAYPDKNDIENNLKVIKLNDLPKYCRENKDRIVWLYEEFFVADSLDYEQVLTFNFSNIGEAFQLYWDGKFVGYRGSIGSQPVENLNTYIHLLKIPYEYASTGKHSLLIKVYYAGNSKEFNDSYIVTGYNRFLTEIAENNYIPMITYTILFISAIFFLAIFFGVGKYEYLFFSVSCAFFGLSAYARSFWYMEDFGVALREGNDELSIYVIPAAFFFLHAYLLFKLSIFPKHKYWSVIILLTVVSALFLREFNYIRLAVAIAALIACYGLYKKDYSSIFILIGIAGFWIISSIIPSGRISKGVVDYQGLLFLIIVITILTSIEIAKNNRRHRESVLKTARLENELLKRNIQPHFILNTLTALQEVVEKYPEKASSLIEALADEFRLFSKVSGEKLINIKDELNICDAHLRIMEYRKGVKFSLTTDGITGDETIPPGIFHTIVENGTTHGFSEVKTGVFNLKKSTIDNCVRYILSNNGRSEEENRAVKKGTGFKYIEARLEESFPGKWKLDYKPVHDGWEVVIDICRNNGGKG